MAEKKIPAPIIRLQDFIDGLPEMKNGRVELVGAFVHYMVEIKKITQDTNANFRQHLEEFRTLPV